MGDIDVAYLSKNFEKYWLTYNTINAVVKILEFLKKVDV